MSHSRRGFSCGGRGDGPDGVCEAAVHNNHDNGVHQDGPKGQARQRLPGRKHPPIIRRNSRRESAGHSDSHGAVRDAQHTARMAYKYRSTRGVDFGVRLFCPLKCLENAQRRMHVSGPLNVSKDSPVQGAKRGRQLGRTRVQRRGRGRGHRVGTPPTAAANSTPALPTRCDRRWCPATAQREGNGGGVRKVARR